MIRINAVIDRIHSGKYKQSLFNVFVSIENDYAIYNSFSGALTILEGNEKLLFDKWVGGSGEVRENELEFFDRAVLNGFILPVDVDEISILQDKYIQIRDDGSSLGVTILPTLDCNFRCNYCFQGVNKAGGKMSVDVQNKLLDFIKHALEGKKSFHVTWFGGEPTLAMPVIKRLSDILIAYCDKKKIYYKAAIITNGYTLSPEIVGELYVRRVTLVQITLDGPSRVHNSIRFVRGVGRGSFKRILANIKKYQNVFPIHTSIRANIDSDNSEQCEELIRELDSILVSKNNLSLYFSPIHASTKACGHIADSVLDVSSFAEMEIKWITSARRIGLHNYSLPPQYMGMCGATKTNGFVIVPNGDIHKCWETVAIPEYKIGSLWQKPNIQPEKEVIWKNWTPFIEPTCRKCSILPSCLGFCRYHFIYRDNYSGNSADNMCPSLKHTICDRIKIYIESVSAGKELPA